MALGSFELDIQRFVDKAKGNTTLVVRKIALDVFKRVIMKTPVDLGRAKGSWQCAIGSIPAGTVELNDKTGAATISKMTAVAMGLKAGEIIYLISNLEYIRPLEFGHSKQAPGGMVRTTLQEFPQVVAKAANEVPK